MFFITGNAHNLTFLQSLLSQNQWDAIIDFMSYSTEEFKGRAKLLLDATNQYVFLSSARVYADSADPITEDSLRLLDACNDKDYLATDEYALAKARQENILAGSGKNNYTIIRPYVTFGENRLQLSALEKEYWLFDALNNKTILFSKDLSEKFTTLTYGEDVAMGIAALIGQQAAYGEAFHITVNESHQWSEILDTYISVIKKKTGCIPQVKLLDSWHPMLGGFPMQIKWDRLYNRRFDNTKISRFIDPSKFKPTLPTLENCLTHYINNPTFLNIDWDKTAQRDRYNKAWMPYDKIPGVKKKVRYTLVRLGLIQ